MIYVPTRHLKTGMVLAQSITHGASFFSLLVEGQKMSEQAIEKLKKHNINGAYIQSKLSIGNDNDNESLFDEEFRKETVTVLKKIYDNHTSAKAMNFSSLKEFSKLADNLIDYALSKDECLVNVLEVKDYDTYTYTHSMDVALLAVMLGMKLKYPRTLLGELAMCGLLHDIGKTDIPIKIINKPGALTPDEFETIKKHPEYAVSRLSVVKNYFPSVVSGIESHHEYYDGTGYPNGLSGNDIPVYGRILALADVFDALTSSRTYRKAWAPNDVIEYMMGEVSTHFDYNLLSVFLKTVAAYPIGTIVKLSDSSMGVVTASNAENCLRPVVKIISPSESAGEEIDLSTDRGMLSVTVIGTIGDNDELPFSLFE